MKTRNTLNNALTLVALMIIVALVIAPWQSAKVQAVQGANGGPSDFGFIDLSAGQTARLTVVNTRRQSDPEQPPISPGNSTLAHRVRLAFDIYVSPPPEPDDPSCITRYRYLRRDSCDLLLREGETVSYDYTSGAHVKIAASIHSLGGPDTRGGDQQITPEPHLTPLLEVREGMRTIFVVPAVIKAFNPQPDPAVIP